jgi:hypothetical protein
VAARKVAHGEALLSIVSLPTCSVPVLQNGFTLHGPKGTGKSSMMLFLSLALFTLGWAVVYIPSCARWLEKAGESLQAEHFLKHAEVGLRLHRQRRIKSTSGVPAGAKTWGDLLLARDAAARPAMLALLEELHDVADTPVVFLFDDVGSVWKEGKQRDPMFRLGAGFGQVKFCGNLRPSRCLNVIFSESQKRHQAIRLFWQQRVLETGSCCICLVLANLLASGARGESEARHGARRCSDVRR